MPRPKTTQKSAETREHILRTAERLFRSEGFQNATLRRIADEAGVALGLSYRYFPQKEDLALALYLELAEKLEAATRDAYRAPLADLFADALRKKLQLAEPHRDALAALFAASLTSPDGVSVTGPRAAPVREKVRAVFARVVARASDLPALDEDHARALGTVLYGVHLLVVLAWLLDRRGGSSLVVDAAHELLSRAAPLLAMPPFLHAVTRAARWLDPFLEGAS